MPIKSFPFVYHDGIKIKYKKSSGVYSLKKLRTMFEFYAIDDIDMSILIDLQKYLFLNAYLIKILLSRHISECKGEFCNNRLQQLEKKGFVTKFQFVYVDDNQVEHATPFVYRLSEAAHKIFEIRIDKKRNDSMFDVDYVQRRLAFNQFHIMLENQYHDEIRYSHYAVRKEYDGIYRFSVNGSLLLFYVFAIRGTENWEKNYLEKIRVFKNYTKENQLPVSALLVICEYEMQALKAEKSRMGDVELKDLSVYYLCDYASVAEGSIFQYLIKVNDDGSSYDMLQLRLDGKIKENV